MKEGTDSKRKTISRRGRSGSHDQTNGGGISGTGLSMCVSTSTMEMSDNRTTTSRYAWDQKRRVNNQKNTSTDKTTPGCVFMTQPPLPRPPMDHRASPTSALYRIQVISYKVCTCRAGPVPKSKRRRFLPSRQSKYANTRALPTHGVYRSREGLAQANGFCLRFLRVVCLCGRAVQELLLCNVTRRCCSSDSCRLQGM